MQVANSVIGNITKYILGANSVIGDISLSKKKEVFNANPLYFFNIFV